MIAYYVNLYENAGVPEIHEFEAEKFQDGFVFFKTESILDAEKVYNSKTAAVIGSIGVGHFQHRQEAIEFIRSFLERNVAGAKTLLDSHQNRLNEFEKSLLEK